MDSVSARRVAQNADRLLRGGSEGTRRPVEKNTQELFERIEGSYDATIVAAVAAAAAAAARPSAASNTDILYIGLNPQSAEAEKGALRKTGAVHAVGVGSTIHGVKYDFSSASDIYRFVDSLGLDPRTTASVADALLQTPSHRRPVIAQIASHLAAGERGGSVPSRLVISAHSGGSDFYGMGGGFSAEDLQRLGKAMPRAAKQVRDLHFSACSTSGQAGLEDCRTAWLEAFPHLKTIWAYAGHSDLAPTRDLETWGRATNHPHEGIDLGNGGKSSGSASHHVATWSAKDGYRDSMSLPELRRSQMEADRRFVDLVSGAKDAAGFHEDAMVDYETYRILSQRSDVPANERALFAKRADQLLRIRYYNEGVRHEFVQRHGRALDRGFTALGMKPADFGGLDRAHALLAIAEFEARVNAASPVPAEAAAALSTLRGFRDLDPRTVFETDCHHRGER